MSPVFLIAHRALCPLRIILSPHLRSVALLLMCLAFGQRAQAAVNDVFPGDYTTLPPGYSTITFYAYDQRGRGLYANGTKLAAAELDVKIAALRISHFIKVGGASFSPMLVLAWADAAPGRDAFSSLLGPSARGMADVRLGGTLWLMEDTDAGEYVALTGSLILPTGSYRANQSINIGENRTTLVIGGGWVRPLTNDWTLTINPEIAFYSTNDSYLGNNVLRQDPSYALGSNLQYRLTSQTKLFTEVQLNRGGATSVNGIDLDNPGNATKFALGLSYLTQHQQQWMLRYRRDLRIDNGVRTDHEVALRYLIYFD